MTARGEFQRLAALRRHLASDGPGIPVGVGDDAAVVNVAGGSVVVCADALVEGVHFRRDLSSPADVGWKAIAVNASDLAAMGARPLAALVVLQRPPGLPEADIEGLYQGLAEAGRAYGMPIVGGDTVSGPVWSVAVTGIGEPGADVATRAAARPGDQVVLVGELGAAAAALWADDQRVEVPDDLLAAHRRPTAWVAAGQALVSAGVRAMIDISDGLGADAGHLARSSGVRLELRGSSVMRLAAPGVVELVPAEEQEAIIFGGGEDFALLACVGPKDVDVVSATLDGLEGTPWRWIGEVMEPSVRGPGVWLLHLGREQRIDHLGYDHG